MTICTCWMPYPNIMHKKIDGKWKCVDCYKNIHSISYPHANERKTKCVKKEKGE